MSFPPHSSPVLVRPATPIDRTIAVGIAYAALGAIAFSGKAIIVKLGYRYAADAITLIALRMAVATPFFIAMAWYASTRPGVLPLSWRDRRLIVVLGFLGYYVASLLDFMGLAYVSAALERLILYLNPTLVLLIGLFFGRRTNPRQVAALAVGYAGIFIAFAHDFRLAGPAGGGSIVAGSLLVFGSAVAYALYLFGSGEIVKRVGPMRLTAYSSCVAALFCMLHFFVTRPAALLAQLPLPVYGLSFLNGTLCTVLPIFAVMLGVSRLGAGVASQVGMIGPASTIVLADLLLGEKMGPAQIAGTLLVMVGVAIVSQSKVIPALPAITKSTA